MKIVVTGASGYVGRNIVPVLKGQCEELVLVGRDPVKLKQIFPDITSCTLAELPTVAKGFDSLVHLAVLNNNVQGDEADFHSVNVELTCKMAEAARACGIKSFYNISSVHVLDDQNLALYAKTKRAAIKALKEVKGIDVTNVYLPFVRGAQWNGKLAFLSTMPSVIAKPLESCLLALKPTVKIELLADYILHPPYHKDTVILSDGQSHNLAYRVIKRGLDLLFALLVIGFFWWALLLVWILVRCGSSGPGIFAQERVGRYGKPFTCYKFRTMKEGTVQAGTHEVSQASVTGIGKFLRGTKVDELPQVWNILKNEISLIGPRPGLPVQTELFKQRKDRGVFDVKPGISGLAQVNNVDMSDPEKLAQWDARYISLQSLLLDIKITLATVLGNGQGDKVAK
ncbi:hybrid nucleoside-diphosphate sugar epimerase/sugar transferase [Sulfitobacter sp. CW3]|uniref:hybrid nucleoside-diphosphate sugar epimerase/sugar transferase n=1 Tax=Sulfitobacter sp. CW3 TaxID=2861965 RepID=UPI001C601C4D|nr:hybrid nucleoside-diphosphate sugar epimerase/sugar transferase [Sulfitobacter sp. CW3]MBW4964217.1 sugar transferase [Sulfitobacter sp. CW3]